MPAFPEGAGTSLPPSTLPGRFPLQKAFTGPEIPLRPCSGVSGRSAGPSSSATFTALCSVPSRHIVNKWNHCPVSHPVPS